LSGASFIVDEGDQWAGLWQRKLATSTNSRNRAFSLSGITRDRSFRDGAGADMRCPTLPNVAFPNQGLWQYASGFFAVTVRNASLVQSSIEALLSRLACTQTQGKSYVA